LHVTLVEGTPISLPDEIPDLLGPDGRFHNDMVGSGFRFFFSPRIRRQLETEIRAQFEAFKRTGLALDHANAHKHIHLHPTVANLILRIGRDFDLKALRIPWEPPAPIAAAGGPRDSFAAAALRAWTGQLRAAARRAGVLTNDQVFGLAWSGAMTESRLLALLPNLPAGLSEIYFHPARLTTAALARTMPSYRHAEELAALLSPRVAAALSEAGIVRTSFGEIAA
jgi:hopanoid biosynthesis associated protein HpnK